MKVPRTYNWTIRSSRFGYRAWVQDELGYWCTCDFVCIPSIEQILASWTGFYKVRCPIWHMEKDEP